jgi:hypothetical protein
MIALIKLTSYSHGKFITRLKDRQTRFDKTQPLIHMENSLQDSKTDRLALIKLNLLFTWKLHLHRFKDRRTRFDNTQPHINTNTKAKCSRSHSRYTVLCTIRLRLSITLLSNTQPHIYTNTDSKFLRYSSMCTQTQTQH